MSGELITSGGVLVLGIASIWYRAWLDSSAEIERVDQQELLFSVPTLCGRHPPVAMNGTNPKKHDLCLDYDL